MCVIGEEGSRCDRYGEMRGRVRRAQEKSVRGGGKGRGREGKEKGRKSVVFS